jgi:hypothetical protein
LLVKGAGALGALTVLGAASGLAESAAAAGRTAVKARKGGTLVIGADAGAIRANQIPIAEFQLAAWRGRIATTNRPATDTRRSHRPNLCVSRS